MSSHHRPRNGRAHSPDPHLLSELAELTASVHAAPSLQETLARLLEASLAVVPGCNHASVSMKVDGSTRTAAATDETAMAVDELQYQTGQGPSLDAFDAGIVAADSEGWTRWPRLADAKPAAVQGVCSCGLRGGDDTAVATLNLYSRRPDGIPWEDLEIVRLLGAHGGVAIEHATEREARAHRASAWPEPLLRLREIDIRSVRTTLGRIASPVRQSSGRFRRARRRTAVVDEPTGRTRSGRVAAAFTEMLEGAHAVPPDLVHALARDVAADCGARATRIWLADYAQRQLLPFGQPAPTEALEVAGTIGGRAFRSKQIVQVPRGGATTLWVPLANGSHRLGVVEFEVDGRSDQLRDELARIAKLIASEIVARSQFTDAMARSRRNVDLTLAAELQWSFLPPPSFTTPDVSVAAALEPAYSVAGDSYEYAYNDGVLHAAVIDAIGHDLEACLVAAVLLGAYRWGRRRRLDLEEVAYAIDDAVADRFPDAKFGTAVLSELDLTTGRFRWVNNGHPRPLLIRENRVVGTMTGAQSPPLGLASLVGPGSMSVCERVLQPGDRVLLYTDGIIEARTPRGEDFGLDRLEDFLQRALASGFSDDEVVRRLAHAVVDHHGGLLRDDATTLLFNWHPQEQRYGLRPRP